MFVKSMRPAILLAAAFVVAPSLYAQGRGDDPPVVGRPGNFSHLVGTYQIDSFSAEPTDVVVEDPILVTVLISGKGPAKYEPKRALLRLFGDDVEHDFYVEPVPERERVYHWRHRGRWRTWEFVYRFRPKSTSVDALPSPRLSYYKPGWGFATAKIDTKIRLTVTPRPKLETDDVGDLNVQAPDRFYQIITGDAVLARDDVGTYMTVPLLLAVGFGAPLASWLGLALWAWLLPDGLRRMQRRRSQAAGRAMRELGHEGRTVDDLVRIVTTYLSQRLDFPAVEPTPAEVARFLGRRGVSPTIRSRWTELFQEFDEMRYSSAAQDSTSNSRSSRAAQLIQALETDPCLARVRSGPLLRSLLLLVLAATAVSASPGGQIPSPVDLLCQAEDNFEQGVRRKQDPRAARKRFADAARDYAALHAQGVRNADLYLNWGNAELLAGRLPRAILAYRRGLRLAPGRADLLDNLAFVRARLPHPVADQAPTVGDTWLSLVPWLSGRLRQLLCLGTCAAYSLASFSFMRWLRVRPSLLPGRALLLLVLAGTSGYFWQRAEAHLQEEKLHPLVVVAHETGLLRGNGSSYPAHAAVPLLYPGTEARRIHRRGDWLQIQLPGGAVGWVPAEAVLLDD